MLSRMAVGQRSCLPPGMLRFTALLIYMSIVQVVLEYWIHLQWSSSCKDHDQEVFLFTTCVFARHGPWRWKCLFNWQTTKGIQATARYERGISKIFPATGRACKRCKNLESGNIYLTKWQSKLAESKTRYTLQLFVYTGKWETPGAHGLAFGTLNKFCSKYLEHKDYMDTFKTSNHLLEHLFQFKTLACGTTRNIS